MAEQNDRPMPSADRIAPWLRLLIGGAAALSLLMFAPEPALAATLLVNSTADKVDASPGNGVCAATTGECTLRAAVMEANALPGADEIRLPAGIYTLTITGAGEDGAATGDLDITDAVTITSWLGGAANPDPTLTVIQAGTAKGAGIDRVFSINPSFSSAFATVIRGVTIRYGTNSDPSDATYYGGGLDWDGAGTGSLEIDNCIIAENTSVYGPGGGLVASYGTVTITRSTIRNNSGVLYGGGLYFGTVTATILDSTVDSNKVAQPSEASTAAYGGGVYSAEGSMTIDRSAITNNLATGIAGGGGGLMLQSAATIANSTISGNSSKAQGGGLLHQTTTGTATLTNVTITANRSDSDSAGGDLGGGIYLGGNATLHNSIVADNYRGPGEGTEDNISASGVYALGAASSYNLIGTGGSGGLVNGALGNLVGVEDPGIGSLADNGGPTKTHALTAASPAIDAGNPAPVPEGAKDQRGGPRVVDHIGTTNEELLDTAARMDMGAFEAHPSIENIADQTVSGATSLLFRIADPSVITGVTATSSNQAVIPDANLSLSAGTELWNRRLSMTAAASGTTTITVTVQSALGEAEGTFEVTATVVPDLTITQSDSGPFTQGGSGSYTATATNSGTISTSGTVTLAVSLSAGLSATGLTGDGWSCVLGTLTCTRSDALAPAGSYPAVTLTVTVSHNAPATVSSTPTLSGGGDPGGASVTTTTSVIPTAQPPAVTPATTAEDTQSAAGLVITPNALDGPEVTHFKITGITGGRLYKSNGTTEITSGAFITVAEGAAGLRFTPAADLNSSGDSFSFGVQAAIGSSADSSLSSTVTASITVTAVNDPPQPEADLLAAVDEDSGEITIPFADLLGNDLPGPANESAQTLILTGVAPGTGGTVSMTAAEALFTPTPNFSGMASFTYVIRDSAGAMAPGTVIIPVVPIADTPGVTGATTAEDTQSTAGLVITPNALDGPEVTHFKITGITGGRLYKSDGTSEITGGAFITVAEGAAGLRFTPAENQHTGSFGFTVQAATSAAGDGLSGAATATTTVTEVNDPPVGVNDTLAAVMAEDSGPWSIPFTALVGNDSPGPVNEAGQSLTVASVGSAVGGAVVISGTDVIFTPTAHFNGTASFSYTVGDNGTTNGAPDAKSAAAPATASFTVTEVNDAPVASADTLSAVAEDSGTLTIPVAALTANDSQGPGNESGQTLTVTAVTAVTGGAVSLGAGNVLFTPDLNFYGTASFSYTVSDNGTTGGAADSKTAEATVSIPVDPSAEAPTVTAATTAEESQSATGLVITRSAVDGAEVTHFRITGITGGKLYQHDGATEIQDGDFITAAAGGAGLRFTPTADLNSPAGGSFSFAVAAALDALGAGLSPVTAATITVTEVNDAPVGVNDTLSPVAEDSGTLTLPFAALTANDSRGAANESGQALTISEVTAITGGGVTLSGGNVLFTPSADFYGTASFSYTISDDGTTGGAADPKTGTATVFIPVTTVADAPQVTATTTAEESQSNTGLVITRNGVDGAEVTHFKLTAITGGKLYQHDGATELQEGDFITAAEGGAGLKFTPTADLNSPSGGSFSFAVAAGLDAMGTGLSAATTAPITVTEVNDPPVGVNDTLAAVMAEDSGPWSIPFTALVGNDSPGPVNEAGQSLTVLSVGSPVGGTAVISGTDVIFTPTADFHGTASFSYTVGDNGTTNGAPDAKSAAAPATASFTVTEVNDAPVPGADTLGAVAEDSGTRTIPFSLLLGNDSPGPADESGQTLTIAAVSGGVHGVVSISGTDVLFTPEADFFGTASFQYTVADNGMTGGAPDPKSSTGSVSFAVTPLPDPPAVASATTAEESQSAVGGLVITPALVDGLAVTHFRITGITGGTLYKADGATALADGDYITAAEGAAGLRFTPLPQLNSPAGDSFGFAVQAALDAVGTGLSGQTAASITVTEGNDAPVAADDSLSPAAEDSGVRTIPFTALLGNDQPGPANESGQSLTITGVSDATGGTAVISGTNLLFTPAPDFVGTAGFTYRVTDNGTSAGAPDVQSHTARVSFSVTPVNDPPLPGEDSLPSVAEDSGPFALAAADLLANDLPGPADEAGQALTVLSVGGATGGTVTLAGTTITFTPAANFNGPAGFSYTVGDDGLSAGAADPREQTGLATFLVTPVNDPPVALDGTLQAVAGSTQSGVLAGEDLDGGDLLMYSIVTDPALGTVQITNSATGAFTYNPWRSGTDSFSFQVSDGKAVSNVATVSITIQDPPPQPVPPLAVTWPPALTREPTATIGGTTGPFMLVQVGQRRVRADAAGGFEAVIPLVEGTNLITVSVENRPPESFVVTRDSTPPPLRLTASVTETEAETALLTAVSEEGATLLIEGEPGPTRTVPLTQGANRFTAVATDRAGNQSSAFVVVVRVMPRQGTVVVQPGQPAQLVTEELRIDLPAGAAPAPLHLRVVTEPGQSGAPARPAGVVAVIAEVNASLTDGTPVHDLGKAVTLIFTYDPERVPNPQTLAVYWFDPARQAWVRMGGVVDETAHTITLTVDHFSWFAVMAVQEVAPVLDSLPESVSRAALRVSGTGAPGSRITLLVNGQPAGSTAIGADSRFALMVNLAEGENRLSVKSDSALTSPEGLVRYRPAPPETSNPPEAGLTDLEGHWARESIVEMVGLGVVKGYEDGTFRPELPVSRLEFTVMVARLLKLEPSLEPLPFSDAGQIPDWATGQAAAAVKAGIIRGRADGSFAPGDSVTRAEVAVMLTRVLQYKGQALPTGDAAFADRAAIPEWALSQVMSAARFGLVTGYADGTFRPAGMATRAEAVAMLQRLMKALPE